MAFRLAVPSLAALVLSFVPRIVRAADLATFADDAAAVASAKPDSLAALDSLARRDPLARRTMVASATPDSLATLAAFPAPRVRAWQVGVLRPDRLEHAGLSFTLGAAFTLAFRDRLPAAALTLALGAGKEYWDARHADGGVGSGADALDLVADAAGLGLAIVLIRGRAP